MADEDHRGDPIEAALARVRSRLQQRRDSGELPEFPPGELERHFEGVVEAVEAGLLAEPPIDVAPLFQASTPDVSAVPLESEIPGGSLAHRAVLKVTRRGLAAVLEQFSRYARANTEIVAGLVDRQGRLQDLVLQVQLDRIRGLERRVADLEVEVERLRRSRSGS